MSDDMRLLILTHLRAAMERKDWRPVERAYVLLGGLGAGAARADEAKSPGDPFRARDGASEGAAA